MQAGRSKDWHGSTSRLMRASCSPRAMDLYSILLPNFRRRTRKTSKARLDRNGPPIRPPYPPVAADSWASSGTPRRPSGVPIFLPIPTLLSPWTCTSLNRGMETVRPSDRMNGTCLLPAVRPFYIRPFPRVSRRPFPTRFRGATIPPLPGRRKLILWGTRLLGDAVYPLSFTFPQHCQLGRA